MSNAEKEWKERYDGHEEREEDSIVEVEVKARDVITRCEVQNIGESDKQEKSYHADGTVADVRERKEEFRTPHGVEKERTGSNDFRTTCDVAGIIKRKTDADEFADDNERGSENTLDHKRVCRTNIAEIGSTQLIVSKMCTPAGKFIDFTRSSLRR